MFDYARLIKATYIGDYRVHLGFADGVEADVDFSDQLWGFMHEPLKDKALFAQVCVNPEVHVLQWPNGADMAPEISYEKALQALGKNQ